MLKVKQFRELVVRPTLEHLDLWSKAAENLLVGTAIQESGLKFLKQKGNGPALGVFQIEPDTHTDVWVNYLNNRAGQGELGRVIAHDFPRPNDYHGSLVWDMAYATVIARVIYLRRPEPLPNADDVPGLAAYWKQWYNTPLGKGTEEEFIKNYLKYGV